MITASQANALTLETEPQRLKKQLEHDNICLLEMMENIKEMAKIGHRIAFLHEDVGEHYYKTLEELGYKILQSTESGGGIETINERGCIVW